MSKKPSKALLPVIAISLMTVVSAVASFNLALPSVATDTGASQTQLTWIVDAYTVVFAGLLLFSGAVGDRFGRKYLLIAGLAIYAVANIWGIIDGQNTTPENLIAIRAITGVGASMIMPTTLSVITTTFEKEERSKAVGVWTGVAAGGAVLGIVGTATLMVWFPWTCFFWLNLGFATIGLLGAIAVVPNSRGENHPLDWFGGLLSLVGVAGLVWGIVFGPEDGWDSPTVITPLAIGALGLVSFVFWELRAKHPLLDPRVFKNRAFAGGSLSIAVQFFAQFGFFFVAMQYLQFVGKLEPYQAANMLLPMPFVVIPMSRISGILSKRFPQKILGSIGLTIFGSALLLLSSMGDHLDFWKFEIAVALLALGVGFAATPATTAITTSLPPEKQGVASAVNDVAREFGSALGIAILGAGINDHYRTSMKEFVKTLTYPAGVPAAVTDKVQQQINDFAVKSAGFTRLEHPETKLGQAWQVVSGFWENLVNHALKYFAEGSTHALQLAGFVALAGALAIAIIAPNRKDREQLIR
jgi:EmrB/QacA subfamily drug resistance transporter